MKKIILISLGVLGLLIAICAMVWPKKTNTVSDFALFPCEFRLADTISVSSSDGAYTLSRASGQWQITTPVQETVDPWAAAELDRLLSSRVFVDEKREITETEKQRLMHERPTQVSFSASGQTLCTFELGRGEKLPTVDSERRWVFMDNTSHAWRTFVPLMDYAQLFEQPLVGWRSRMLLEVPAHEIKGLEIWTQPESYQLRADAPKNKDNPRGWRIAKAEREGNSVATDFEIDARRVATIVELITPFMVDDWVDHLPQSEQETLYFGGRLTVETAENTHTIQIGPEIDFTKHPEWARHGEGARFVKIEGQTRLGIMTARRLLGILPALDDMRTKFVWKVDSTRFAAIDIVVGDACLRYAPTAPDVWSGIPCTPAPDSETVKPQAIENSVMATFVKALTSLQAVRYATAQEHASAADLAASPAARILIYQDEDKRLAYALHLSAPVNQMYRYAMTISVAPDGSQVSGPIFLLTNAMSQFLLGDLTKVPAQGGF